MSEINVPGMYINGLYKMSFIIISVLDLPDWCIGEEELVDEDNVHSGPRKRKRELQKEVN